MRRNFMVGSAGIGLAGAVWLAAALLTADSCSRWNPLSCKGPDPELIKYAR